MTMRDIACAYFCVVPPAIFCKLIIIMVPFFVRNIQAGHSVEEGATISIGEEQRMHASRSVCIDSYIFAMMIGDDFDYEK